MKRLVIWAVCATAIMAGCKNRGKAEATAEAKTAGDSLIEVIIEEADTTPLPMFLTGDAQHMRLLYWTDLEEPQRSEDNEEWFEELHQDWALQDMFRRNAVQYTNLLAADGKTFKVKYVDEVLEDPDGNQPSIGELHGRDEIPALSARFALVNSKDEAYGEVVVTDSYLASRKRLNIEYEEYLDDGSRVPLPASIIRQLMSQYGMKVENSVKMATIGGRYVVGAVQFAGEYKNAPKAAPGSSRDYPKALALEVIIDSSKVYACERLGYYSEEGCTWNADDGGEYFPCDIVAAFEGPKGLELCYSHGAPESYEVGMFYLRDGQYVQHTYTYYHTLVDEEIPVWKRDFAEMRRLYLESNPHEHKDVKLTKWSHVYIDYDNEWIWLRDTADENGAIFLRKDGKFRLVVEETPHLKLSRMRKDDLTAVQASGTSGGASYYRDIHMFRNGRETEHLTVLEVYGEIDEATLNGKPVSKERARAFMDGLPEGEEINAYFKEIDQPQ